MLRTKLANDIREKCSAKAGVLGQLGLRRTNPALTKALRGLLGTGLLAGTSYAGLKKMDNYNMAESTYPRLSFPDAEAPVEVPVETPDAEAPVEVPVEVPVEAPVEKAIPEPVLEPEPKLELTDEDHAMGAFVNKLRGHRFATDPAGTVSDALKEKAMPYVKTYDELFDRASELDPWDPMHMSGLFYDAYFGDKAKYNENYPKPPALHVLAPGLRIARGFDENSSTGTAAKVLERNGTIIAPGNYNEEVIYRGRATPGIRSNHNLEFASTDEIRDSIRNNRVILARNTSDPIMALSALAHELGESYHMQPNKPYAFKHFEDSAHGGPSAIFNELYARNALTKEELKGDYLPASRRESGQADIINEALRETGETPLTYEYVRDGALNKTHPTAEHRKKLYMAIKRLYEENKENL